MPEPIPFPVRSRPNPAARLDEVTAYGTVGPLSVALVRRNDDLKGLIHIVVTGPAVIGVEMVATLPDTAQGHAAAEFAGQAVVRALELAETAFTCRPEAG